MYTHTHIYIYIYINIIYTNINAVRRGNMRYETRRHMLR